MPRCHFVLTALIASALLLCAAAPPALARGGFADIPFDYCFEASAQDNQFGGAPVLDGTWVHDNGSDAFDGSSPEPDDGAPGGAAILALPGEGDGGGDASVLWLEDVGDPTGMGFPDPSNRKVFFQKNTSDLLDLADGVTFLLRMRLNESSEEVPPEQAGYNLHDGGKGIGFVQRAAGTGVQTGNFSLHISNEGQLEFATDFGNAGICGEFEAEDPLSGCLPLDDPFEWNTVWVALEETGEGVHAAIYLNGELDPVYDDLVFAPPVGYDGPTDWMSYIAMELGSTGQNGSHFVDYFCVAAGFFEPEEIAVGCPSGLVASASGRDVLLEWGNGESNPTSVDIRRNGELIADDAPADPPSFTDAGVQPGDTLDYELLFNVPGGACSALAASFGTCPTGIAARSTVAGVELNWTNVLEYDGITVRRGDEVLAELAGTDDSYLDASPLPGASTYTIEPTNGACTSALTVSYLRAPPATGDFSAEPLAFAYTLDPPADADAGEYLQHNPVPGDEGNLDGLWTIGNGSDSWDGSEPGDVGDPVLDPVAPAPGGIGLLADGDLGAYLFEDTGDPTGAGFADPSNRKVYPCLDLATVSGLDPLDEPVNHLFEGITLRARFRLTPPSGAVDLPADTLPDGTATGFGGKGMFTLYQDTASTLLPGFTHRLGIALEVNPLDPGNGELIIGEGDGRSLRVLIEDPTAWHDVWVTARDADGDDLTAELALEVYFNGSAEPTVMVDDFLPPEGGLETSTALFPSGNALCMGFPSTADTGSMEVDLVAVTFQFSAPEGDGALGSVFLRGDTDGNGVLEVTDPINSLAFQFLGTFQPPCLDAADFDDNGSIEITDPISNLSHQFLGTTPPAAPGSETCGPDPTEDALDCAEYPSAICN